MTQFTDKLDTSLQAQYLTFTRRETLYSLKCRRREVYIAADWDTCSCFRELPVWIYPFCCGVTTFITNPKYSKVLGNQGDPVGRLQGQKAIEDNVEASLITRRQGSDVLSGTESPDVRG